MSLKLKAQTAKNLGVLNLARVAVYQLGVRSGLNPVKRLNQASISGAFVSSFICFSSM